MRNVKILGPGCARCQKTAALVLAEADRLGVAIELEKITDLATIAGFGVMSTPGIVVDGEVVHAGGLPETAAIAGWLTG